MNIFKKYIVQKVAGGAVSAVPTSSMVHLDKCEMT